MKTRIVLLILLAAVMLPGLTACWQKIQESTLKISQISTDPDDPPVYGYRVVKSYSHDPGAFTQGLIYEDGVLYEGTGMRGQSSLRRVELETGEVSQIRRLPGGLASKTCCIINTPFAIFCHYNTTFVLTLYSQACSHASPRRAR